METLVVSTWVEILARRLMEKLARIGSRKRNGLNLFKLYPTVWSGSVCAAGLGLCAPLVAFKQ